MRAMLLIEHDVTVTVTDRIDLSFCCSENVTVLRVEHCNAELEISKTFVSGN